MLWLIVALTTAVLWGTGQVLLKIGFSHLSSLWSALMSATINALIYIPFALFNHASLAVSPLNLFLIFCVTFLFIFFFYAIEKGQLAFAGTIFATYPITTVILSSIFLHEQLSFFQLLLIGVVIIGSMLLTQGKSNKKTKIKSQWLLWAIVGAITTGAGDFIAKIVLNSTPLQTYNFYYPLMYFVAASIFWLTDKKGRKISSVRVSTFSFTVIGVVFLTCGLLSLNYAISLYKVSLVSTVSSIYMAVTVLLAYIFLHEKITLKQLVALLLIILGVSLMSIS